MRIIITEQQFNILSSFKKNNKNNLIFMGGLEKDNKHPTYLNLDEQVSKFSEGLSENFSIKSFHHTELNKVIEEIKKNPTTYVVLYSKSCEYSDTISKLINKKNRLYIVEPYAVGGSLSVTNAVNNGVPPSNVIVGPENYRGYGVVQNTTKTPSNLDHWESLTFAAKLISSKLYVTI